MNFLLLIWIVTMQKKLTVVFTAIAILSSSVVSAEPEMLAYVDPDLNRFIDAPATLEKQSDDRKNRHHYKIQPQTSKIEFRVDSPIGVISASFEDFGGNFLILGTEAQKNPATIKVNTHSLVTNSSLIKSMLRGEEFFDVENFPSMRFHGDSFEWINKTQAVLKGDMTIKNVTRPVAFYIEVVDADENNLRSDSITMKASANIKRSDFEIFSLLPVVSDDVSLVVKIDALKNGIAENTNSHIAINRLNKAALDTLEIATMRKEKQQQVKKNTASINRSQSGPCSGKTARFLSTCR